MSEEKQQIYDDKLDPSIRSCLYTGSDIKTDSTKKFMQKLMKLHPLCYQDVDKRVEESWPIIKSKIQRIKKKIIQDQVVLGNNGEFYSDELKTFLKTIFSQEKPDITDYEIMQVIKLGREKINDKISVENLMERRSKILNDIFNDLMKDFRQEEDLIQNWNSVNQNIDKINKMDDFQFNQWHSSNGGEVKRQQTRLNTLIE